MRFVMWGVRLLKISTSRVLLQDSPPVGSQSVVHLGFTAPFSGMGVGRLSLCSVALVPADGALYGCVALTRDMGVAETAKAQASVHYPLCALFQGFRREGNAL